MIINDREYQCWHEVGHAIACILSRGAVNSVELAKANCKIPYEDTDGKIGLDTSAGGYTTEYMYYY